MTLDASAPSAAPAPTRRRRVWLRRLTILAVVLVLLVLVSPLALALPFVRSLVASRVSEVVGRPVTIRKAFAFWGTGIDLEGIRVDSPSGFDEPLATIRRVHVDVDLLAAIGGGLEADVEVHEPWITFQKDSEGRRNTEGLFPDRDRDRDDDATRGASPGRVRVRVIDGVVRARRPGGDVPEELDDIRLDFEVAPDGGMEFAFTGTAKRAVLGGGDAGIEVAISLPTSGEGPVRIHVPPIDLARVAGLLGGATGVSGLRGRIALAAEGTTRPGPALAGKASVEADDLAFTTADGNPVAIRTLRFDGAFEGERESTVGGLTLLLEDVVLGKGPLSWESYREKRIVLRMRAERSPGEASGPSTLFVERAESAMLGLDTTPGGAPLSITSSADGIGIQGVVDARLDLAAVARAFGRAMGLERTDRMEGTLRLQSRFGIANAEGQVNSGLLGEGIRLPDSWGAGVPPAKIVGKANVTASRDALEVVIPSFEGMGLQLKARATLPTGSGDADVGIASADLQLTGDLARARSLVAPFLGLEPRAELAGRVDTKLTLEAEDARRRLRGQTFVTGLAYRDEAGRLVVSEPRVEITKDVLLSADPGGRHRVDVFRLLSTGMTAELSGRAEGSGRNLELDGRLMLSGDAARLAPTLARYLGEEYADLTGRGPIAGRLGVRGKPARGLAGLIADGQIEPGSWSAGGLTLANPMLRLARADLSAPQLVTLRSGVNDGRVDLSTSLTPRSETVAWTAKLDLKGVDTSPLVVDHGLGRYLVFLFPTILPAGATTQVLSGLLDADLELAAADVGEPLLLPSLTGQGKVEMKNGAIGESTLFRAVGRERGLGDVGRALAAAVPEVQRELEGLSRSLTFEHVTSSFVVAKEILTVRHGLLSGQRVQIGFTGRVGLRTERVDLKVPVTLAGKGGERLGRVLPSKTIPLTIQGPLAKPRITPDLKATDLAGGALEGLLKGDGNPVDRIKDLFGR